MNDTTTQLPRADAAWDWPPTQPPGQEPPKQKRRWGRRAGAGVALVALSLGSGAAGAGLVELTNDDAPAATSPATSGLTVQGGEVAASGLSAVAAKVLPSVVSIRVSGPQGSGEGSGVVLDSDGMILTNNHVVEGAGGPTDYTVTFSNGSSAEAQVVGTDPATDLAVVQVTGVEDLKPATFAAADSLDVGDGVLAIGSPLGLEGSVTSGIVSALHRSVNLGTAQDGTASILPDAIQTDAAINPGNSGGALVDLAGRVVGINTAIASLGAGGGSGSIGLGFAIPVGQALSVAESLMKGEQPSQPVLGVSISQTSQGALVRAVTAGSGAAAAGLRPGDLITAVDREPIGEEGLPVLIRRFQPGDTITVTYRRGAIERTVKAELGSTTS